MIDPALDFMVRAQIAGRGVRDPAVLATMRQVPRGEFVPEGLRHRATEDGPLPIGHGATISQPYVVAAMAEAARIRPGHRVLDVGTGSGYQAAVLASLGADVVSIERVPELAASAADRLARLGYAVEVVVGDGHRGWPARAPYDRIVVAAAPERVPDALLDQLHRDGGRLVIPVGSEDDQELLVLERDGDRFTRKRLFQVLFVPLRPDGPAGAPPDGGAGA